MVKNIRNTINHVAGFSSADEISESETVTGIVGLNFLERFNNTVSGNKITDINSLYEYHNIKAVVKEGVRLTKEVRDSENDIITNDEFNNILNAEISVEAE